MNTANLQLEGLYLVITSLNELLITKGVLTPQGVDNALRRAAQTAISDYNVEEMGPANCDAVRGRIPPMNSLTFGLRDRSTAPC